MCLSLDNRSRLDERPRVGYKVLRVCPSGVLASALQSKNWLALGGSALPSEWSGYNGLYMWRKLQDARDFMYKRDEVVAVVTAWGWGEQDGVASRHEHMVINAVIEGRKHLLRRVRRRYPGLPVAV